MCGTRGAVRGSSRWGSQYMCQGKLSFRARTFAAIAEEGRRKSRLTV